MPSKYEDALQATNVAIQESITVKQTQQNVIIDMQTQINQASIKAPVVVNEAEAKYNSTLVTNKAHMESFVKITTIEAKAYGIMKDKLKMQTDEEFLKYMRVKTINQFNQKNLLIGIAPSVEIKSDPNGANQQNG